MDPSEAKVLEPQFIKIYHDLIEEETQLNPDSLTRSSLKKLRKAYSKKVRQRGTSIVSFASASTRCAYIYQYCPCFTSAVAFHFSQMLHKNPTLLANIICQDTLTVCCLGGGPAAEIVAISMVLEKVLQQNDHHRQKPLIINAVIVDNDAGWICTMNNVIDKLNQHLDQSIVHLSCRFMESDLMKPLTGEVKEVVRNSDVVTMIKFLSAVLGPTEETEGTRLVQETIKSMRKEGIFFLLDSSGFKFFDTYDRDINSSEYMNEIYGTVKNTYRLLPQSRKHLKEFSRSHNMPLPTIFTCNKIGAWCKQPLVN